MKPRKILWVLIMIKLIKLKKIFKIYQKLKIYHKLPIILTINKKVTIFTKT